MTLVSKPEGYVGTLVIYRGLPGSGKTTEARSRIEDTREGVLAGRDHIRPLCGVVGGIGSNKQETLVTKKQDQFIREGLRRGETVHVDDLNLRSKYVTRLLKLGMEEKATIEVRDLTNVLPQVCVQQDRDRDRTVGEKLILDLYDRFVKGKNHPLPLPAVTDKMAPSGLYIPDESLPRVWLVDIDGTVAKMNGRGPHDYDLVGTDLPNRSVIQVVNALAAWNTRLVFLSGRPDSHREQTRLWLNKHVTLYYDQLLMRKAGDHRPDDIVKRELFDEWVRNSYNVQGVLDDRNRVVEMWRGLGLTCLQVDEGDF